jgi:hypothetical protein
MLPNSYFIKLTFLDSQNPLPGTTKPGTTRRGKMRRSHEIDQCLAQNPL